MDDHDDPFKRMVDDGKGDSAADELEFDLNQLGEARPDLAPETLDADGLVDFDRCVATNKSRPLSVDEIVNEYPQPVETVEDCSSDEDEVPDEPIFPRSRNEVNETIEILNRLTLFTTDLDLDPLLLKVSNKINPRKLDRMKQNLLLVIFLKNSNYSILILIFCKF